MHSRGRPRYGWSGLASKGGTGMYVATVDLTGMSAAWRGCC